MKRNVGYVLVLLAGSGCGSSEDVAPSTALAKSSPPVVALVVHARLGGDARSYDDRADRVRFRLPSGWFRASARARDSLTLTEGVVLAAATSPVRPRADAACSDAVDEPRMHVGPAGALVVVSEDRRSNAELARKRPRFTVFPRVRPPGAERRARTMVFPSWRCRNTVGVSGLHETQFADAGRVFTASVLIGKAATAKTRGEALGLLNSFRPLGG